MQHFLIKNPCFVRWLLATLYRVIHNSLTHFTRSGKVNGGYDLTCTLPMESETLQTSFFFFFFSLTWSKCQPFVKSQTSSRLSISAKTGCSIYLPISEIAAIFVFLRGYVKGSALSRLYHRVCLSTAATTGSAFVPPLPQGLPFSRRYHRVCLSTVASTVSAFVTPLPQGLLFYRLYHRVCPTCEDESSQPSEKSN